MKLVEMAKHTSHDLEKYVSKIIEYCNDNQYVVKATPPYNINHSDMIRAAGYFNQEYIDKWYEDVDEMEPFVSIEYYDAEDADIWSPREFADAAQVFELKRIK